MWQQLLNSTVLRHTAVAFIDRALLSLTNFAVGILLIRRVPTEDYGRYVLAQAAILLVFFIQNALITIPMTVLAPKYESEPRRQFINALGQRQYLIWLPLAVMVILGAIVGQSYGLDMAMTRIINAVAVVFLFVLLREFIRVGFFVYMRPYAVLCVDATYGAIFLGAVYLVTSISPTPTVHTLIAMGLANLVAGGIGLALFYRHIGWTLSRAPHALATTLKPGKWALMGVLLTWFQTEGFLYLLGALKGTADVASVSAIRLLLMPVIMLTASFESIIKPRGAAWLANGDKRKMEKTIIQLTGGALAVAAAYIGCMWFVREAIVSLVFKTEIADMQLLLPLWSGVFLLRICTTNLSIVMQIFERFDTLFYVGLVSAVISFTVGYAAIYKFGAPGSLVGLITVEVVSLTGMAMWLYRCQRISFALPRA